MDRRIDIIDRYIDIDDATLTIDSRERVEIRKGPNTGHQ